MNMAVFKSEKDIGSKPPDFWLKRGCIFIIVEMNGYGIVIQTPLGVFRVPPRWMQPLCVEDIYDV